MIVIMGRNSSIYTNKETAAIAIANRNNLAMLILQSSAGEKYEE